MAILWILFGMAIVAMVGRWAWQFQMRAMHVVGVRLADLAGKPGTLVDIELTSVLADHHSTVLIAFQPAGMKVRPRHGTSALPPVSTLVLRLPDDAQTALARLERWQASAAPLLLWRDPAEDLIELSQIETRQSVRLATLDSVFPKLLWETGNH